MLSLREGRRQKRENLKAIDADLRRQAKAKLRALREAIKAAKVGRREAMRAAVVRCREDRRIAKERAKELRRAALEALRAAIRGERLEARRSCDLAKGEARALGTRTEQARAAYQAERSYQREIKRIEQGNRAAHREIKRASSKERRGESDDEVRANIAPEYLQLFERVKRSIRAGPRQTRTEAFLKYAEEHPGELLEAIDAETDRRIAEMQRSEAKLAKAIRRRRYSAEELAAVPF
jgi:hypothetical protein